MTFFFKGITLRSLLKFEHLDILSSCQALRTGALVNYILTKKCVKVFSIVSANFKGYSFYLFQSCNYQEITEVLDKLIINLLYDMEDNFATVKMTDKKKCLNNSVKTIKTVFKS